MSKIRVHALAKEIGISSKELIEKLKEMNIDVKNHMSNIENNDIDRVKSLYMRKGDSIKDKKTAESEKPKAKDGEQKKNKPNKKGGSTKPNMPSKLKTDSEDDYQRTKKIKSHRPNREKTQNDENKTFVKRDLSKKAPKKKVKSHKKKEEDLNSENSVIKINPPMTVKNFADELKISVAQVITKLIGLGIMASQNQEIDEDTCILLADDFGIQVEIEKSEDFSIEEQLNLDFEDDEKSLKPRPPVVTVMGHVDHGKTSLLDAIKKSHIQGSEAGGITQHIGAYTVSVNNKKVTFLDTPGHEAFTAMRLRGALITDIAVLVVAADDGVMPQTVEAISHAKSAGVPIIVAINKIDKGTGNIDRVKQELLENGLMPEEWGGDTIMVGVSARTEEGIPELLEMILLVAEMLELKANPNRNAIGTVIDAKLDKGKGPMATILVSKGTMKFGDNVVSGISSGRIRAMTDDKKRTIKKAGPSMPAVILGLSDVPNAGDPIYVVDDEKTARSIAEKNQEQLRMDKMAKGSKVSLDNLFDKLKEGEMKDLNIIVKGDVKGSVEALNQSLEKLSNEEVKIKIIHSGVGGINESDISLASASSAIVIGFNVRPNINALDLSKTEEVDVRTYRVIYDIINDIEAAVNGMLEPNIIEEIQGRCEVRQTFKLPGNTIVAGVYVISGKIPRNSMVKVLRDDVVIHEGAISSLKRFKDDVKELATGFEGGLGIDNFNDIKEGDLLESYILKEVKRA
ncbi:MAG: translation initiation factor IF-2 [Peptoniphilus sp.]|nr:translation initiation factor IF-2 [Peptoniphilus sp.]